MSVDYLKNRNSTVNPEMLTQTLMEQKPSDLEFGVEWRGFRPHDTDTRWFEPISGTQQVGSQNGVPIMADPGDILFKCSRALAANEESWLETRLSQHDHTDLSTEQQLREQDDLDWVELRNYWDILKATTFDALTPAQRDAGMKKLCRLVFRCLNELDE